MYSAGTFCWRYCEKSSVESVLLVIMYKSVNGCSESGSVDADAIRVAVGVRSGIPSSDSGALVVSGS